MKEFDELLRAISKLGIERRYLEQIAPEWVRTYGPKTPTDLLEAKLHFASMLGLDVSTLLTGQPKFREEGNVVRYKRSRNIPDVALECSTSMFKALASHVAELTPNGHFTLTESAEELRSKLTNDGRQQIELELLVNYLWDLGIPVVHYTFLPPKLSRPDAMVVGVSGRPCIIIGSKRLPPAWHLFYVAHEIGHIAKGHVERDGAIVDQTIGGGEEEEDQQEEEANDYGLKLVGGPNPKLPPKGIAMPDRLARIARKLGGDQAVDPGHLLLRYATTTREWGLVGAALNEFSFDEAPGLINGIARRRLNFYDSSNASVAFVDKALGPIP